MKCSFLIPAFLGLACSLPISERSESSVIQWIINHIPSVDGDIKDVAGVITSLEVLGAAITLTPTSENDLSRPCKDVTVIYARGTADPGNVGFLTGPTWFDAMKGLHRSVAVQGVNYDASVDGFLAGGDASGGPTMASLVARAFSQCPNTKVVMGGYSQGAQIVHNAVALIPAATMSRISAVVVFGDPDNGRTVPNIDAARVLSVCHAADNICHAGDVILPAHLTYAIDSSSAATFAISNAGY